MLLSVPFFPSEFTMFAESIMRCAEELYHEGVISGG